MFSDKLKKKKMPFGTLEPSLSTSTPHNASVGRKSLFLQALSHNSSVNKFPQLNFSTKKKTCTVNGKTKLQSCSEGSESFPDAGNEQSDCDITVDESEEEWLPPGGHSLCDIDKNLTDIPAAEEMCQYPNEGQGLANEADAAPSTGKSILDICSHQQECRANALKWGLWRCPVLSELIRGLTDACAYHQWDLVLALLPCIAVRSFPMLSLQYSVEMATALESCGGLQAENVHPQLRLLAPNKTVQLLSSIVQHCSKKNQATSSGLHEPPTLSNVLDTSQPMDVNTEAILQEWDKLLKDEDNVVRHKGLSKMDRYFIEAYKGILCYVRWKKMEENRELSSIQTNPLHCTTSPDPSFINSDTEDVADFALRELTKDVSPEDLADQSVVLMEEAFDAIAEPVGLVTLIKANNYLLLTLYYSNVLNV
ncbi:hypothetical protein FHG87_011415 [Trinorchestia longiramus]|nr:hypothetical protein FHG87_011415 [Trinorchestia longiramus]